MDGILLVDKPAGMTSHDVVDQVRRALEVRQVGHTGTLDPAATGLLVIALGKACRLVQFMEDHEKEYAFTVRLGVRTDTDDAEGKIVEERDASKVTRAACDSAFARFTGRIVQRPPAFSAVKIEGRRAYQLARQGKPVDIPERTVEIHEARILKFDPPHVECVVRCSKGTYIRSIARDFGDALGVGGSISALRRTAVGPFRVDRAAKLGDSLKDSILPPDAGLESLPRMDLGDEEARHFGQGQLIQLPLAGPRVRVYHDARFLGIGEEKDGHLKARVVIAQ